MDKDSVEPIRIFVHPLLVEEFRYLQNIIEEQEGYKIQGGMPIVSYIVAIRLKQKRLENKKVLSGNIKKIKGEKKISLSLNLNRTNREMDFIESNRKTGS